MSEKELLNAIVESGHILKNLLKNRLMKIAKMQNLSQNGLKKIAKMQGSSQNKLEQITKLRHIKNIGNMSKEELLIALLNSEQSHAELYKSKYNNTKIEETRKILNEIRNKIKKPRIKKFREDLLKYEKGLESENGRKKIQYARKLEGNKIVLEELRERIKKKLLQTNKN